MKDKIQKLNMEKNELKEKFLNEQISSEEYNHRKEEIESEISELEKNINQENIHKQEKENMETEYKHRVIQKGAKKEVKADTWKYISIILAALLLFSVFSNNFSLGGSSISKNTVNYINNNLLDPGVEAKLISTEKVNGLYKLRMDINGQELESYVSKDGKLLFPSGIDLTGNLGPSIDTNSNVNGATGDVKEVSIDDDEIMGDVNAPVTIVEFSDYECPFCARFYTQTFGQLKEEYIDTGKVRFVYRDFPLGFHKNAQKAAEAAECAGEQGKYYEMGDKLFADGVSGGVTSFKQYAKDLGLDQSKFDECLDSGKYRDETQKDLSDGAALGVTGTPAFFINGKLLSGAQPFSAFQNIIEEELSK